MTEIPTLVQELFLQCRKVNLFFGMIGMAARGCQKHTSKLLPSDTGPHTFCRHFRQFTHRLHPARPYRLGPPSLSLRSRRVLRSATADQRNHRLGLFAAMAVLNSSGDGRTPLFKSIPEETTEVGRNTCQVPAIEASAAESSVTLKDGVIDGLPVEAIGVVCSVLVMDWTAV